MRECIYCGRTLEKGEQCGCAISTQKRMEKQAAQQNTNAESSPKSDKQTRKEQSRSQKAKAEKERVKKSRPKTERPRYNYSSDGNVFVNLWQNIKAFLKSPAEAIMNPKGMGQLEILILAGLEGAIGGLCLFSVLTGTSRGALRLLGNLIGFNGIIGYGYVYWWLMSAVSGVLSGIALVLLYSAVFYAIGRWVFRLFATYWDYVKRLVFASMPMTLIGVLGVILGIFSQTTFAVLLLCGLAGNIAITYEVLRSMWSSKSASRTLYAMMLGIFVFLTVIMYIVRLSVL